MDDAPLVCLDFWCRAGSVWERPEESGIAHFLEHMVFKGSQQLAAGEFDRRIEALGGSSNAATGFDDVRFHVLMPPEAAAEGLELLLDLVLAPALDPEAFAMERQVVLEELAQSEDQPDDVAVQTLLSRACPAHSYGLPILGLKERLLAHTPEAMAAFHRRRYTAERCVLALSGAVAAAGLDGVVERSALAALPGGNGDPPMPAFSLQSGVHRFQPGQLHPAHEQLSGMGADLLTTLLAEGRRSRLVDRLREQLRLVESIDLDLHVLECGSLALLEAVCEPHELATVREAIDAVWRETLAEAIGEAEWQRCRRLVANGYRFGLESAGGLAGLIGSNALWGREQPLQHPLELLEQWSAAALQSQLLPLLDPGRACVVQAVPA
jgi:zinc protease